MHAEGAVSSCGAVIVAHTRIDLAGACVRSLRRWLPPDDIAVVLNVPDAVEQPALEELQKHAMVISPASPQGYGANVNLGVQALGGRHELLLLANDDVVFDNGSFEALVQCVHESPRIGLAGARLVYPDGREATSFSRFPTVADLVEATVPLPRPLWRWRTSHHRPWEVRPGTRGFPVGAVLLVRQKAFADVGGFDEDFFLNWEEADFSFRLLEQGWDVVTCRAATVTHLQGASIGRDVNFTSFYGGLRLYFKKRLGTTRWLLLELLLVTLFSAGLGYDAIASVGRPRTAVLRSNRARDRWRTRVFLRRIVKER